jgi:hypothetical protein
MNKGDTVFNSVLGKGTVLAVSPDGVVAVKFEQGTTRSVKSDRLQVISDGPKSVHESSVISSLESTDRTDEIAALELLDSFLAKYGLIGLGERTAKDFLVSNGYRKVSQSPSFCAYIKPNKYGLIERRTIEQNLFDLKPKSQLKSESANNVPNISTEKAKENNDSNYIATVKSDSEWHVAEWMANPSFQSFYTFCSETDFKDSLQFLIPLILLSSFQDLSEYEANNATIHISFQNIADDCIGCYLFGKTIKNFDDGVSYTIKYVFDNLLGSDGEYNNQSLSKANNKCVSDVVEPLFSRVFAKRQKAFRSMTSTDGVDIDSSVVIAASKGRAYLDNVCFGRLIKFLNNAGDDIVSIQSFVSHAATLLNSSTNISFLIAQYYGDSDLALPAIDRPKFLKFKASLNAGLYSMSEIKSMLDACGLAHGDKEAISYLQLTNYRLIEKKMVLDRRYSDLNDYFYKTISDYATNNDVYRENNKYHLVEFDDSVKSLCQEMVLLQQGNGVYMTKKHMAENGVTTSTIKTLALKIRWLPKERRFFSSRNISDWFSDDPVVSYCGDEKQLNQILYSIHGLKWFLDEKKNPVFSFADTSVLNGLFLQFLMGSKNERDVYDIIDEARDRFYVEYSLRLIQIAARSIEYVYSEEMERVYKSKAIFYKEVYKNGN